MQTMNQAINDAEEDWSSARSAELYGINAWGAGYFDLSSQGEAQVNVDFGDQQVVVSLMDIVLGMRARGLHMPAVLRIRNLLDHRIKVLNESFALAIDRAATRTVTAACFRSRSTSSAT
jgi:arginine decarboxylase